MKWIHTEAQGNNPSFPWAISDITAISNSSVFKLVSETLEPMFLSLDPKYHGGPALDPRIDLNSECQGLSLLTATWDLWTLTSLCHLSKAGLACFINHPYYTLVSDLSTPLAMHVVPALKNLFV